MNNEIFVWTLMRDGPFVLGGSKHYVPTGTTVLPTSGPHDLGCEFEGYVITSPDGTTYVAEKSSGAFVGSNLADVRRDIAEGGIDLMLSQVNKARNDAETARRIPFEQFWQNMRYAR